MLKSDEHTHLFVTLLLRFALCLLKVAKVLLTKTPQEQHTQLQRLSCTLVEKLLSADNPSRSICRFVARYLHVQAAAV